jgi:predicted DNA-binding transcriptional regulator AlpA
MDAMIKFAFERMDQQLTAMTERIKQLESRCQQLEKLKQPISSVTTIPSNDELINVKVAKTILDVSRNTFLTMVAKGLFTPIKMNLRTIRYSRSEIQRFIDQKLGLVVGT